METMKFKIRKPEAANGDKKITKSSRLSKAKFTLMGGILGAGAAFAASSYAQTSEDPEKNKPESNQEAGPVKEPVKEPQEPASATEPQHSENITEPQPLDSHQTQDQPTANTNEEEIDPEEVAQALAHEIDEEDIDAETYIIPDGYDYAYLPDGTQQMVLIGHTPEGEEYILADLDGNGYYGDIFDAEGNYVASTEGLSVSDVIEMVDDSGEFLQAIAEPWEDDPSEDIVNVQSEEVDEEELLAQLTEEIDEDEEDEDIQIYEGEEAYGELE